MIKVALVGKPNVGKSTLFNRIINKKKSIVDDQPGVTRDRIYAPANWLNRHFIVIDTGGLTNKKVSFQQNIERQVKFAIDEANIIVFLVSCKEGINTEDYYVTKVLKKYKSKQVILVVNKSENDNGQNIKQYYSLGFGKPHFISSEHGIGVGDLLDQIIKATASDISSNNNEGFAFSIVGRTNVGKSTLVNTILREDRVLVSPIAHTTRDSIDVDFNYNSKPYTIIDTAGIRRKGKITDNIEKYAVMRTEQAIDRSNLVLFMIDGSEEFNEQDEVIGGLAYKANIPTIICVNKWDKVQKNERTMVEMTKLIRQRFKYLSWAPIIFISAQENKRVHTIFETIDEIRKQLTLNVSTSLLNDVIAKAQISNPPPAFKGGRANLSYATQVKSQIPTFVVFGNDPKHIHISYARYIENQIRESFGITMVPITVYFKDKNARTRGARKDR
ncbi:MAG: ribosome biogenesis GTPase Der [Mycoplasmataceae bacterium]|nr:ribosome biogenesis GTPase Der [Mycoplasmataceae bacterium]